MFHLPQASYIVIDPCYVMKDEYYNELCDKLGFNGAEEIEINGHKLAVSGTAYGDGCYDSNKGTNFPVDSGMIGAIPFELCDSEKLNSDWNLKHSEILKDQDVVFKYDNGTFFINDLLIYTAYEEEEEEEEDEYFF